MLKLFLNKEAKYIDYKDGNTENCKIDNLGILNGAYKLNKQKIEEIYHKRLAGEKLIVLSLEYGISKDTVVRIMKRIPSPIGLVPQDPFEERYLKILMKINLEKFLVIYQKESLFGFLAN